MRQTDGRTDEQTDRLSDSICCASLSCVANKMDLIVDCDTLDSFKHGNIKYVHFKVSLCRLINRTLETCNTQKVLLVIVVVVVVVVVVAVVLLRVQAELV